MIPFHNLHVSQYLVELSPYLQPACLLNCLVQAIQKSVSGNSTPNLSPLRGKALLGSSSPNFIGHSPDYISFELKGPCVPEGPIY